MCSLENPLSNPPHSEIFSEMYIWVNFMYTKLCNASSMLHLVIIEIEKPLGHRSPQY